MPGRCSGRFVWLQLVAQSELMASGKRKQSQTSVVGLSLAKSTYCPWPVLVYFWFNLGVPVALVNEDAFHGDLDYDAL
ncbi:hypothetical protein DPMN_109646 [Dreissena polymorpha]|uniref:Uncharacterized protein n=1 Tax=Dreissena polymorpha TaxID=45954 RepID=A0A9D4KBI5_DREPO|nr:hypothetical protein DPMN_109646 [Dreissena polymorpha]